MHPRRALVGPESEFPRLSRREKMMMKQEKRVLKQEKKEERGGNENSLHTDAEVSSV
jgi:hypothetical protein